MTFLQRAPQSNQASPSLKVSYLKPTSPQSRKKKRKKNRKKPKSQRESQSSSACAYAKIGDARVPLFVSTTVYSYEFLAGANAALKLAASTSKQDADKVSEEDFEKLSTLTERLEQDIAANDMNRSAKNKARDVLFLLKGEIERLTPLPVQVIRAHNFKKTKKQRK